MKSRIRWHEAEGLFVLRLATSVYSLRVLESGEVVHVGWMPLYLSPNEAFIPRRLDDYQSSHFSWDAQATRYEYPAAGDITYHESAIRAVFAEPPAPLQEGEAFHGTVRDLRLRYRAHEITNAQPGLARRHARGTVRETLAIHLHDTAYEFELTLFYRLTPERDLLERWVEVRNQTASAVKLERLDFGCAILPNGTATLTRVAGQWGREFIPKTQELTQGLFILEQLGLNTGHAHNPFFLLHGPDGALEEAGNVWFGALAYSGNWSLRFECQQSNEVRVFGGYATTDFELILAPGESHRTPSFIMGVSSDGLGGASRRLHRFARERVLPGYAANLFRPILYNSWEATYFNLSEEGQIELARIAASIGVELFCMDDGWFGARANDRAGLGDWSARPEIFPRGLRPLADEVHSLGMKFGLWVEPEMVNPDSDLYRAHPDWVLHYPGRPRTEARHQLILDFGRREVIEHIFNVLDRLVRENTIDFLKWDMNRYATEAGSAAGRNVWRAHVAAVYEIMDRLRASHPQLEIESCSGGGGRVDFGILQRCDQVWTSDNTDACDRTRIQDGFSIAYPARIMEAWVTHEKNHQTGRISSLDLRFDVAMRGALGIGSPLQELNEEELEAYRRKIAFYKRIRPIVQEGDLFRLATAAQGGVSTWLYVAPDRSAAVYSTVVLEHLLGIFRAPAVLRGLAGERVYRLLDEYEKEIGRYSGLQLMTLGLPGDTVGKSVRSRTTLLEATN